LPDIKALVVPPYSLSKSLMERIKDNYRVIEADKLKVGDVEPQLKQKKGN